MLNLNVALTEIMRSEELEVHTPKIKFVMKHGNLSTESVNQEIAFLYKFTSPRIQIEISTKEIPDALCLADSDISLFITRILNRANLKELLKLPKKVWVTTKEKK